MFSKLLALQLPSSPSQPQSQRQITKHQENPFYKPRSSANWNLDIAREVGWGPHPKASLGLAADLPGLAPSLAVAWCPQKQTADPRHLPCVHTHRAMAGQPHPPPEEGGSLNCQQNSAGVYPPQLVAVTSQILFIHPLCGLPFC